MRSIAEILTEIETLLHKGYMKLIHWFNERDWNQWDQEIEEHSSSGKLDFLLEEALDEKKNNKLRDL